MSAREPNPIDLYISSVEPQRNPIDDYLGAFDPMGDEESRSAWRSFIEGTGRVFMTLASISPGLQHAVPQDERTARQLVFGAGFLGGSILEPLEGLAGLPNAITGEVLGTRFEGTEKARRFLERAREGIYSQTEMVAKGAGMSDLDIGAAYSTGDFVGFIAPVAASVKIASLVLRAPATLAKYPAAGGIVTDWVAGGIFGMVFKPEEEASDRLYNMLHESAMFGVTRAILTVSVPIFLTLRNKRVRESEAAAKVQELVKRMERGENVVVDDSETAQRLMRLLSEENYLASSPVGQEILARSADESALVGAIMDVARARGSGGRLRAVKQTLPEADALASQFREQFPGLKFEVLKGPSGYDIVFGSKGLNNKQRAQIKKDPDGFFEGQKVFTQEGSELAVVGPATRQEWVRVRRADGTVTEMKRKNLTELPIFEESFAPGPRISALYDDFLAFMENGAREASNFGGQIPESALIRAAREGTLKLNDNARRAFDSGGAIIFPEELGLRVGADNIAHIRLIPGPEGVQAGAKAMIVRNSAFGQNPSERAWRVSLYDDASRPLDHRLFDTIEDASRYAQEAGWLPIEQRLALTTTEEIRGMISRYGIEFANLLENPQIIPFEKIFDSWIAQRGLPVEAADLLATRVHFADRVRRELWASVPEPDRKIFDAIRKEFTEAIEKNGLPFEVLAHQKGFHAEVSPGGRVALRDIYTGRRLEFSSQRIAEDALRAVVRDEASMLPNMLPFDSNGMPSVTSGTRTPADNWNITAQAFQKDNVENIPISAWRNVRDWLIEIEKTSGIPLFSKGFSMVDEGISKMRNMYEPWALQIRDAWKGISLDRRKAVVEFWRQVEGSSTPIRETVRLMREQGFSEREILAFTRSRAIWDAGYELAGLPRGRYIENYYGRIRPYADENGGRIDFKRIFGDEGVPPEFQFFAEFQRTGELATIEMDPEIVMHKWFRSLFFKQEVKPHWDRLAQLVDSDYGLYKRPALKISDLPQETIEQIRRVNPSLDIEEPVLAGPIRDVISEYLTVVRGNPGKNLQELRWFSTKLFKSLGVTADPRVMEEFSNTMMSMMYGAAMGARPSLVARNQTQTIWNLWTRLGSRDMNKSLERGLTLEGFNEAVEAGALRMMDAGVPLGDAIFGHMLKDAVIQRNNPLGFATEAAIRLGLRTGQVSRKFAEKLLIPYSTGDQMARAWAYHWQKMHTERLLNAFETRRIGWEKFVEDGMPFFSKVVKDRFTQMYRQEGSEAALRWIGKQAADEAHYIYGVGAQPGWMQRPLGRFLGMFGTHPIWTSELYVRRMWNGTLKQRAAFAARNIALMGAFGNMMYQSGVDLWSWVMPLSWMGWAGGPAAEHVINAKRVIDAPIDEKAEALKRFAFNFGRLSVPGQLAFNDILAASDMTNPGDAFMRLMMGRPSDHEHFSMTYLYGGRNTAPEDFFQDPATERAVRIPWEAPLSAPGLDLPLIQNMGVSRRQQVERVEFGLPGPLGELEGNWP